MTKKKKNQVYFSIKDHTYTISREKLKDTLEIVRSKAVTDGKICIYCVSKDGVYLATNILPSSTEEYRKEKLSYVSKGYRVHSYVPDEAQETKDA